MKQQELKRSVAEFVNGYYRTNEGKQHTADHERRAKRAAELLTAERIPKLTEQELREMFFDSDAFHFYRDQEQEFKKRLKKFGIDGLRGSLATLVERGEKGLRAQDLEEVWEKRGLGILLSTELLAHRFPTKYWMYSPNVTLPALEALGEDVKSMMPHGQKSNTYIYMTLGDRMRQVREALRDAGIQDADNSVADMFLWWVGKRVPIPMRIFEKSKKWGADIEALVNQFGSLQPKDVKALPREDIWKLWTADKFAQTGVPNQPKPKDDGQWKCLCQMTALLADRSKDAGERYRSAYAEGRTGFGARYIQPPNVLRTLLILEGGQIRHDCNQEPYQPGPAMVR
jgi:hypothetical protein